MKHHLFSVMRIALIVFLVVTSVIILSALVAIVMTLVQYYVTGCLK